MNAVLIEIAGGPNIVLVIEAALLAYIRHNSGII